MGSPEKVFHCVLPSQDSGTILPLPAPLLPLFRFRGRGLPSHPLPSWPQERRVVCDSYPRATRLWSGDRGSRPLPGRTTPETRGLHTGGLRSSGGWAGPPGTRAVVGGPESHGSDHRRKEPKSLCPPRPFCLHRRRIRLRYTQVLLRTLCGRKVPRGRRSDTDSTSVTEGVPSPVVSDRCHLTGDRRGRPHSHFGRLEGPQPQIEESSFPLPLQVRPGLLSSTGDQTRPPYGTAGFQ